MPPSDQKYTFNEDANNDKELLARNGYLPGELSAEEEQDILRDLRGQAGNDEDSDKLSSDVPFDERDGTE